MSSITPGTLRCRIPDIRAVQRGHASSIEIYFTLWHNDFGHKTYQYWLLDYVSGLPTGGTLQTTSGLYFYKDDDPEYYK